MPDIPGATLFDPLRWWGERYKKYLLLSQLTKRIFVIPASSSECERHFSAFKAHHIVTAQSSRMFSIILERYKN